MLESDIERELKSIFTKKGFICRSMHGKSSQDNGVPDVVVTGGELTFLFELKRDDNDLSAFQMLFLRKCKIGYKVELLSKQFVFTNYYINKTSYSLLEFMQMHNI